MSLTLLYITNNPEVALIAQKAGVDRIWIDLETLGKEERQAGMNTVKSKHSIGDIKKIKPLLTTSKMMVRVNPLYDGSKKEIDNVIEAGAEYIMLPMYRTKEDVEQFISMVNGRAKVMLLLETIEAEKNLESYIDLPGIDEIHIGLNDLHLAYKKKFMFELLCDGTVENIAKIMKKHKMKFGFGGFARVGHGILPAEMIMIEHYRLGSSMAILSRGFCDANIVKNPKEIEDIFIEGVKEIRKKEKEVEHYTDEQFMKNKQNVILVVSDIVKKSEGN
ncbi:aldolase/citrate lyase family protein [Thomasclavelia spiroformis]|uniref:aldolase/citrate lyase family protein n=1 Tax=Thomasclavelia spiroformis TaxID=29348 RepID=UPI0026745253|nr:aldolase/citrate lyase family protein [Thomasclavelia spiroformis]